MIKLGETKMARSNFSASSAQSGGQKVGLILGTALASLALASCASSAPPAQVSFNKAQSALEEGKVDKAISYAEAAVLASPRDPEYRATLGTAYLEAGRYQSAATAFGDAIDLGDNRGRTALSYALTQAANGNNRDAVRVLQARQNSIPRVDLGLALALAGEADRGVALLVEAIREGNTSPKARQNLAYAYSLAGNWRAARVMAAEDVPADQLDTRLSNWAASARPEDHMLRVSNLLGLKLVSDGGQPGHLALANFPTQQQMAKEAEQLAMAEPQTSPEVVAAPVVKPVAQPVALASSAPAPSIAPPIAQPSAAKPRPATPPAPRFVSNAVVQKVQTSAPTPSVAARSTPSRASAPAPRTSAPVRSTPASGSADTHRIQMGSFNSREVAEQKWGEFQRRFPALKGHDAVITEARVNGRTYFRVAAAGFGARSARSMCGSVKASGLGCFAYAKSSPPAGAVERDIRVASRSR